MIIISFQLHTGDYLSFFDGKDLQSQKIQSLDKNFNFKKITISSSGKDMLVQFLTDDYMVFWGFKAYFHFIPIDSNCENWLDRTASLLKSPDYPAIDCSWVITAPSIASTIIIQFASFEVECFCFKNFIGMFIWIKLLNFFSSGM